MWYGLLIFAFPSDIVDVISGKPEIGNPVVDISGRRGCAIKNVHIVHLYTREGIRCNTCDARSGDREDRQPDTVEKCHVSDLGHTGGNGDVADRIAIIKAAVGNRRERC